MPDDARVVSVINASINIGELEALPCLSPANLHKSVAHCRKLFPAPESIELDIFMFKLYYLSQRVIDREHRKFFEELNDRLRKYKAGINQETHESRYTQKQRQDRDHTANIQTRNYKYYIFRRQTLKCIEDKLPEIIDRFEMKALEVRGKARSCVDRIEREKIEEKHKVIIAALGHETVAANLENLYGLHKHITHERSHLDFNPQSQQIGAFTLRENENPNVSGEFILLNKEDLNDDPTVDALNKINGAKIHKPLSVYMEERQFVSNMGSAIRDVIKKAAQVNKALNTLCKTD